MMRVVRWLLAKILLTLDALFSPKPLARSAESQARAQAAVQGHVLYQFEACPFCIKVRRELKRLNLQLDLLDATRPEIAEELIRGGGERQVPCLRIPEGTKFRWLYESDDIIAYLRSRVA
jgi:glutaredoxin